MLVDENLSTSTDTNQSKGPSASQSNQAQPANDDTSLLAKITHHPTVRGAAVALSALLGGAGVTTLTGCDQRTSYSQKATAVRSLTKEAKFSTLATDSKIPLPEMPKLLEQREALAKAINGAIPHARAVVMELEAKGGLKATSFEFLTTALEGVAKAATASAEQEGFAAAREKLKELATKAEEVRKLTPDALPKAPLTSPVYLQTKSLMENLYDWSTALDRDIVNLKQGTYALKVANLSTTLSKTESVVQPLLAETSLKSWAALHPQEATKAKEEIATTIDTLKKAIPDPALAPVSNLLSNLASLLTPVSDALTVKSGESVTPPSQPPAQPAPSEAASPQPQRPPEDITREALATIIALRMDLNRELTNTLGAQSQPEVALGAVSPGGATTSAAQEQPTQVVHHHHNSGMNPLVWYMLFNNNSQGAGYTYVPNHTPTYSGTNRFYSSKEYSALQGEVQRNEAKLRPSGGFGSHAPQTDRNGVPNFRPANPRPIQSSGGGAAPSQSSGFSTRRFLGGFGS